MSVPNQELNCQTIQFYGWLELKSWASLGNDVVSSNDSKIILTIIIVRQLFSPTALRAWHDFPISDKGSPILKAIVQNDKYLSCPFGAPHKSYCKWLSKKKQEYNYWNSIKGQKISAVRQFKAIRNRIKSFLLRQRNLFKSHVWHSFEISSTPNFKICIWQRHSKIQNKSFFDLFCWLFWQIIAMPFSANLNWGNDFVSREREKKRKASWK